jgi:hypothetical protein
MQKLIIILLTAVSVVATAKTHHTSTTSEVVSITQTEDEPFKFDGPKDLTEDRVKAYKRVCRTQRGGKSLSELSALYESDKIDLIKLAKSKVCPLRIARDRKIKFWNPLHVAIFYPLKTATSVSFLLGYLKRKGREDLILKILNSKDERGRTMLDLVEQKHRNASGPLRKKKLAHIRKIFCSHGGTFSKIDGSCEEFTR